jgi:hypothetical protein
LKKVKNLTDSTVHERNFNEVEAVFQDNIIEYSSLGKLFDIPLI